MEHLLEKTLTIQCFYHPIPSVSQKGSGEGKHSTPGGGNKATSKKGKSL